MNPEVSIIIPVHNAAPYLRACLESVLAQTFGDFEVLCVDDASTDESGKILYEYANSDERFTVMRGVFGGPSGTRNAALAVARGDYVAFLDADDWWDKALLEKTLARAKDADADMVVFDYWLYYQETGTMGTYRDQDLFARLDGSVVNVATCPELAGFVGIWDRLFRRDVLVPHGFMEGFLYEDAIYCTEAVLKARKVAFMADHLYYYRRNVTASITFTEDASRKHEEDFLVAQAYIQDCLREAGVSVDAWRSYARYFAEYAYMHQREVSPYRRFKSFFSIVHEMAALPKGQYPALFYVCGKDSNEAREIYLSLVRKDKPYSAWMEARCLNAAGKVLGRR